MRNGEVLSRFRWWLSPYLHQTERIRHLIISSTAVSVCMLLVILNRTSFVRKLSSYGRGVVYVYSIGVVRDIVAFVFVDSCIIVWCVLARCFEYAFIVFVCTSWLFHDDICKMDEAVDTIILHTFSRFHARRSRSTVARLARAIGGESGGKVHIQVVIW